MKRNQSSKQETNAHRLTEKNNEPDPKPRQPAALPGIVAQAVPSSPGRCWRPAMKITRIILYAAVLVFGLLLVQTVSSRDASTDDLANLAGQFVPLLILIVAGIITYQARIRGASKGLALGIPLAIQAIIAFGLAAPGFGRLVFVFMLVPMVVVCGLLVMLVKPRGLKAVPKPAQIPSPVPSLLPEAMPTGNPPTGGRWRQWPALQWGLTLLAVSLTAQLLPAGMLYVETKWAVLNAVLGFVYLIVVRGGLWVGLPLTILGLLKQGGLNFSAKRPNAIQPTADEPPTPLASPPSQPKTNRFPGWFSLLLGLAGLAWFPYQIIERRASYGLLGYEEYTIQDNLRSMGPMVLLSLLFAIIGLGTICRWRWANGMALLVGLVLIALALIALNS